MLCGSNTKLSNVFIMNLHSLCRYLITGLRVCQVSCIKRTSARFAVGRLLSLGSNEMKGGVHYCRQVLVWNLLSKGRSQTQVAKELGITQSTVSKEINIALAAIRGWAGREAEDWRNHQLLIIGEQISEIIDDTVVEPEMMFEEGGEPALTRGVNRWVISPSEAAKIRNMARITLAKYLEHQAKLLSLVVERKEIAIDKRVVIGVLGPEGDRLLEMI